ncbi:MAG TPA: mechanosensitive ion channel protein MscS, partial [Thauera sp.]|nr:mechanosensitive ion channel protein MscS [Thauera sp.]
MARKLIPLFTLIVLLALAGLFSAAALAAAAAPVDPTQPPHQRLADLLEDDATRSVLIEQLRSLGEEGAARALEPEAPVESMAGRVAALTQNLAQGTVSEFGAALSALGEATGQLADARLDSVLWQLGEFAVLVVVTLVVFRALAAAAG